MPQTRSSQRAEQRALREKMRGLGMNYRQIAFEFGRRYHFRSRAAWRHAHGWSLAEAASQITSYAVRAGLGHGVTTVAMTSSHLCEMEGWPGEGNKPSGRRPTPYMLSLLAAVYGCAIADLLDTADYQHMRPTERIILDKAAAEAPVMPLIDHDSAPAAKRDVVLMAQLPPAYADSQAAVEPPIVGVPVLNLDEIRHIAAAMEDARRYADSTVAGYLRTQLAACAVSDGTRGPNQTLPRALAIIAAIDRAARDARPAAQRELLVVGARAAEFAGWLYRDSAAPHLASYWHDRSVEWAQMAGDQALQGYVLLKKSQAAWDVRDAHRMLMLARAAREGPWNLPPRVRAEVAQQEARAEAMRGGDIRVVAARLDEARRLLAAEPPAATADDPALAAHYGTSLLAMQTAICYCEAGQAVRAAEIYDEYLNPEVFSRRDYGYFLALAAMSLVAASRPDDAADYGREAAGIAAATGSARTLMELRRLLDMLSPWTGRPAVRAFGAELTANINRP